MADLYYSPVFYGIHDLNIEGKTGSFGLRVYYPSESGSVWEASIRPGKYPLIVFTHGDRSNEPNLCPRDVTEDYKRWGAVLHLLARCGFVVAVPACHNIVHSPEDTAVRIEDTVKWMRGSWAGNATLHYPPMFTEAAPLLLSEQGDQQLAEEHQPLSQDQSKLPVRLLPPIFQFGLPTPLGLAGHSWGARGCARAAVRGVVNVRALASITGSWDDNAANAALLGANAPTLLLAGTADFLNVSYLRGFWPGLTTPKHQAAMQGLGHWDWFGIQGGIRLCDESTAPPDCPIGWQAASELLLGFMTKYLRNHWWRPPYLLGSPGGRPPLLPWFDGPVRCALKIRWDDPTSSSSHGNPGEVTLGAWGESNPW